MRDCAAYQFGCSCEEGQCKSKAVSLGTVKKARPAAHPNPYFVPGAVVLVVVWAGIFASLGGAF